MLRGHPRGQAHANLYSDDEVILRKRLDPGVTDWRAGWNIERINSTGFCEEIFQADWDRGTCIVYILLVILVSYESELRNLNLKYLQRVQNGHVDRLLYSLL